MPFISQKQKMSYLSPPLPLPRLSEAPEPGSDPSAQVLLSIDFKGFKNVFTRKLTLVSHRQGKPMWEAVHQSRLVEVHQLHTLEVHDDDHLYMDNDM